MVRAPFGTIKRITGDIYKVIIYTFVGVNSGTNKGISLRELLRERNCFQKVSKTFSKGRGTT